MIFQDHSWRVGLVLIGLTAMVGTGCTAEEDSKSAESASGELVAGESSGGGVIVDEVGESRPAVREVEEEEVEEWPVLAGDYVGKELATQIDEVSTPVLLPEDRDLLAQAFFAGEEYFYTATMHVDEDSGDRDHTVVIQGSQMVQEMPAEGILTHDLGDEMHITRIHKIPTLTFEAFGISYQVHVECNRPHKNSHCTEDDYIKSIAESLKIAGGQ